MSCIGTLKPFTSHKIEELESTTTHFVRLEHSQSKHNNAVGSRTRVIHFSSSYKPGFNRRCHFYNICNSSAMHIRETDMKESVLKASNGRKRFSIQPYVHFVNSRPKGEKVFLLTDNPSTQNYFLREFPDQILVYSSMDHDIVNQLPSQIRNVEDIKHLLVPEGQRSVSHNTTASDHRFTTLENALIDVIIAAHANIFKPTIFSSLSELVMMFNRIGKRDRGWCRNQ